MASAAHLQALSARHSELDQKIAAEMSRPHPDSVHVAELKRQKLRLKDEIRQER